MHACVCERVCVYVWHRARAEYSGVRQRREGAPRTTVYHRVARRTTAARLLHSRRRTPSNACSDCQCPCSDHQSPASMPFERVDGDYIAAIFDEAFREINLQVSVHCVERSRLTAKVRHPTLPYGP